MEIIFLADPKEFWEKLDNAMNMLHLVAFASHQRTDEVKPLTISEMQAPLDRLCSIWLTTGSVPTNTRGLTPAEEGWILLEPPQVNYECKKLTACWIAAKADWVKDDIIMVNENVRPIFDQLRRQMIKNTKICKARMISSMFDEPRFKRIRYTEKALKLHNDGWALSTRLNGPILELTN